MKQRAEQTEFCPTRRMKQSSESPKRSNEYNRVQLFEGRSTAVKFNPGFLFLCSKAFPLIISSVIFRASNHQLVDKKN